MPILVSFVGLGKHDKSTGSYFYEEVIYHLPGQQEEGVRTCYVAEALTRLLDISEACLVATDKASQHHGERLKAAIAPVPASFSRIPEGRNEKELREQFRILRETLGTIPQDASLILDITHGFRTQPFFAASVLSVLQASGDLPEDTRIVYGAFEAGEERDGIKHVPIWDLTPFLFLQRMAFGIATFLQTGHANLLVNTLREEEQRLRKRTLLGEREKFPDKTISTLIGAIERFANDLSCLRVPAMIIGEMRNRKCVPASSVRLLKALQSYERHSHDDLIAIRPLLDDLQEMVENLQAETFYGAEGQRVLANLGNLYLKFNRYAEAAGVGAEALICRYASGPEATDAGMPVFSKEARERAAELCREKKSNRRELGKRNDLLHAGFRPDPKSAQVLQREIESLVNLISPDSLPSKGRTFFVTRHAGAREWAERQGLVVDEILEHLEPDMVRPGDLVIGSLPIHLVAEINRRGARYKHLSIDIPPEKRGEELSADDMERYGARLEEYRVIRPDRPSDQTEENTT